MAAGVIAQKTTVLQNAWILSQYASDPAACGKNLGLLNLKWYAHTSKTPSLCWRIMSECSLSSGCTVLSSLDGRNNRKWKIQKSTGYLMQSLGENSSFSGSMIPDIPVEQKSQISHNRPVKLLISSDNLWRSLKMTVDRCLPNNRNNSEQICLDKCAAITFECCVKLVGYIFKLFNTIIGALYKTVGMDCVLRTRHIFLDLSVFIWIQEHSSHQDNEIGLSGLKWKTTENKISKHELWKIRIWINQD